MTSLLLPQTFSRYRSIASLGRGSVAEVILAEMRVGRGVTRLAVLKRIWPDLASDAEFVAMFLREARLSALMNHPNVAQTYEVLEDPKRPAIAMEYLGGQPLKRVMERLFRSGGLTLTLKLRILANVLAGLDYAHNLTDHAGTPLGVVHRDLNPQNVVVTYDGQVKLVDFGLAKSLFATRQTGREATGAGARVAYMAPEQLWGTRIDRRADVFSAGVMLWEMLAGRRLWLGLSEATIIRHLMSRAPIRALPTGAQPPEGLSRVCARALAVDPDMRFGSAAEFAAEIERLVPGSDDSHARHLGKIVSLAFAQERAARQALIDKNVRALRLGADKVAISFGAPGSASGPDRPPRRASMPGLTPRLPPAPAMPPRLPPPFRFGEGTSGRSLAAIWGEDEASSSGHTQAIGPECIVSVEPISRAAEARAEEPYEPSAEDHSQSIDSEGIEPEDEALQTTVYLRPAVRRPWKSVVIGFSAATAMLLGAGGLWAAATRSVGDKISTTSPGPRRPSDRPTWSEAKRDAPAPPKPPELGADEKTAPLGEEYSYAFPTRPTGRDSVRNHVTVNRTVHGRSRSEASETADDRTVTRVPEVGSPAEQNDEPPRGHGRMRHPDDDILPPSEEIAQVNSSPVGLISTLGRPPRTRRPIDASDPF